jgi:hypothetical protein
VGFVLGAWVVIHARQRVILKVGHGDDWVAMQDAEQSTRGDVPATQHDAHPLPGDSLPQACGTRKRGSSGALGKLVQRIGIATNGSMYFCFFDFDHVLERVAQDRYRIA